MRCAAARSRFRHRSQFVLYEAEMAFRRLDRTRAEFSRPEDAWRPELRRIVERPRYAMAVFWQTLQVIFRLVGR